MFFGLIGWPKFPGLHLIIQRKKPPAGGERKPSDYENGPTPNTFHNGYLYLIARLDV